MTYEQIKLVKSSWRLLRDLDAQQVADLFYSKLFFEHPELRGLFPADMSGQHQKLMSTLNVLVARLDHLDMLEQEVAALGQRHLQYGVKPKHYRFVGIALLWTLECTLGDDWTEQMAEAWQNLYNTLAGAMIEASKKPQNN